MNKPSSREGGEPLKKLSALLPLFIFVAAVIAVAYFLALKNDYEPSLGYFARGSVTRNVARITAFICMIFSAGTAFLLGRRTEVVRRSPTAPSDIFAYTLAALSSLAVFALFVTGIGYTEYSTLNIVSGASAIISAAYYALMFFAGTRNSDICRVIGCLSALSYLSFLFDRYFDFTLALNADVRNVNTLMLSVGLIEIAADMQVHFASRTAAKNGSAKDSAVFKTQLDPFLHIFSALVSSTVLLGYASGALLYRITQGDPDDPNLALFRLIFLLSLSIIGIARLSRLCGCRSRSTSRANDKV